MKLRETIIERLDQRVFDVLVIGGGINGAVSAAALSARGARVALIDKGDFAGFTSQESSNLAWGGIKYLETFEFGLVRKLCMCRNHLLRNYPSRVHEIRFYTTHTRGFRHGLLKLVLGTWFYWLIGSFFTKTPRLLTVATMAREEPIIDASHADGGFEYSDAYLRDCDARFVFNFVRTAISYGCQAANYVEALSARREDGQWVVDVRDTESDRSFVMRAKSLVNAAGPFVDSFNASIGKKTTHRHVFSKGIHLIVPKLTPNKRVLTFFADDGRLFFVIPMGPRTCIGTTDTKVDSPHVRVTADDRQFVLDNINKRLRLEHPLTEADIIAERCGVRPLVVSGEGGGKSDWMQLSRKHAVEVHEAEAYVAIFGGKLTDCLNVGEEVTAELERLGIALPYHRRKWYGEPPVEARDEFFHQARLMDLDGMTSPRASEPLSTRFWRRYGSDAFSMLEAIRAEPPMAEILIEGAEYTRCEIEHAARREMITKLADFLRRRSKIALVIHRDHLKTAKGLLEACKMLFGEKAQEKLDEYFRDTEPSAT